jgi:hypothetical protein
VKVWQQFDQQCAKDCSGSSRVTHEVDDVGEGGGGGYMLSKMAARKFMRAYAIVPVLGGVFAFVLEVT